MRNAVLLLGLLAAGCGSASSREPGYHVIPGSVPLDRGPDGNSIILDAPEGLVVVDTGRHPAHARAILDYAKSRKRPVAAVVNTHWHLDHTTGNADIRDAYPKVRVYASNALEGALRTYLKASAQQADAALADPATSPARRAEILRAKAVTDNPERIRPDDVVDASGTLEIAGRPLDLHLARFAASEGDVWLYDRDLRVAIVGDLVVGLVPFMDTACTDGWLRALDEVEQVPFEVLIPGHGPQMDRNDFLLWKAAFTEFVRCGRSNTEKRRCVEGWERKAAKFIDEEHRDYVRGAANYYLETHLRSTPEEQDRYCRSLSVPS